MGMCCPIIGKLVADQHKNVTIYDILPISLPNNNQEHSQIE